MSIETRAFAVPIVHPADEAARRSFHVLTLAPFYPSLEDPAQGCFVAEPLEWTERLAIRNQVIAAQPFYRGARLATESKIPAHWESYFALPGKLGLVGAGEFLASRLKSQLSQLKREGRLDLIHAHSALPCGHAAQALAKEFGIPFVVTVHGLDAFFLRQTGTCGKWCSRICRRVYQSASAVICISEAVRHAVEEFVSARTEVVYNGVDENLFRPAAETESRAILSVGNLIPVKGHALLLKAFHRIAHEFPGCTVDIIGDGLERSNLQRLAANLGIASRVFFLGRKSRAEVAAAMRRCSLFALTSEYEGLGCVYLEAMASGTPVIACQGQGIAEIIQHEKNGLLVPPRDQPAVTESLRMLLANPDFRRRLGSAARGCILERHTFAHQARQLAAIYSRCAR